MSASLNAAQAFKRTYKEATTAGGHLDRASGGFGDPVNAAVGGNHGGDPGGIAAHMGAGAAYVQPGPSAPPPTTMPDQQTIDENKKRSIADQLQRRGRASTILTDQNDRLGG